MRTRTRRLLPFANRARRRPSGNPATTSRQYSRDCPTLTTVTSLHPPKRRTYTQRRCLRRIKCLRVPPRFRDEDGRDDTPDTRSLWADSYIEKSLRSFAGEAMEDWKERLNHGQVIGLPVTAPVVAKGASEESRDKIGSWQVHVSSLKN